MTFRRHNSASRSQSSIPISGSGPPASTIRRIISQRWVYAGDRPALFDRNQQSIATAKGSREEARMKYEAAANKALAALDRSWQKRPRRHRAAEAARRACSRRRRATSIWQKNRSKPARPTCFTTSKTERAQRSVLIDVLDAEQSAREAWIEIENAVGFPLMLFRAKRRAPLRLRRRHRRSLRSMAHRTPPIQVPLRRSIDHAVGPNPLRRRPIFRNRKKSPLNDAVAVIGREHEPYGSEQAMVDNRTAPISVIEMEVPDARLVAR